MLKAKIYLISMFNFNLSVCIDTNRNYIGISMYVKYYFFFLLFYFEFIKNVLQQINNN